MGQKRKTVKQRKLSIKDSIAEQKELKESLDNDKKLNTALYPPEYF